MLDEVTANKPEKSLVKNIKRASGRNNTGSITVRHKGGGVKENSELLILNEIQM